MDVKQSTVFNFSHPVDGVNYGFSIPAETKDAACNKLIAALQIIVEELKAVMKAGTKPN
jgi:hypothetical protein